MHAILGAPQAGAYLLSRCSRAMLGIFTICLAINVVPEAAVAQTVKMASVQSSLTSAIHRWAMHRDLYKKNGVDLTEVVLSSGQGTSGIEQLLRGGSDVYIGNPNEIARVNSRSIETNQPTNLIAIAAASPGATTLVVKKGMAFSGLRDLKGKKLGVSALSSAHLVVLRYYLKQVGIAETDLALQLVPIGAPNMPQALLTGQIDAFLHSDPTVAIALANDAGTVAMSPEAFGKAAASPNIALMVRRDWLQKNRAAADGMVKALLEAEADITKTSKEEQIKFFADTFRMEEPVMRAAMDRVSPKMMTIKEASDSFWTVSGQAMVERGEISEKMKPEDVFDFSFDRK